MSQKNQPTNPICEIFGDLFEPRAGADPRPGARFQNGTSPGGMPIHGLPGRPPFMVQGDVARIYGVAPKKLNEARKRNPTKFQAGVDFFPLEKGEVAKCDLAYNGGHLPYAYTRRGAYMFATILQTPEATEQAIRIVEGFMAFEHALEQKAAPAIDPAALTEMIRQAVAAALPRPVSTEPASR